MSNFGSSWRLASGSLLAIVLGGVLAAEASAQPMRTPPAHRNGIRKPPISPQPLNPRPPDLTSPASFIGGSISGTAGTTGDTTGATGATGAGGGLGGGGLGGGGLGGGGLGGGGLGGGGLGGGGLNFRPGTGGGLGGVVRGAGAFSGMKGFGFGGTVEEIRSRPLFQNGVGLAGAAPALQGTLEAIQSTRTSPAKTNELMDESDLASGLLPR